jgi:WD40 repeat protein
MPNPYHVRLAISQYGDRFRAELFTEDLGDTEGQLLPADWRDRFEQWMRYLEGGGDLPANADADVGGQLFAWVLGRGANSVKWAQLLERLEKEPGRPLRLLIDSSTMEELGGRDPDADRIHNLPYGLLFDPQRDCFLFRPAAGRLAIHYVRIIRRCTPRLLNLDPSQRPLRLLLAAGEPAGLDFGGAKQFTQLAGELAAAGAFEVLVCTPEGVKPLREALPGPPGEWAPEMTGRLCRSTPGHLRGALAADGFDLLHLMAHGRGNSLLLCGPGGEAAEVRALELGEWCRGKVQMAFVQVCKAARTAGLGAFGGLAQKLLNPDGGDLAAVVASPYVLEAGQSTRAAVAFYRQLAQGIQPDAALPRDLEQVNWSWAFLELWVRPSSLGDTGTRGAFQFVSPYRGLARFEERDADMFFGRDAEVRELLHILETDAVVTVVGDAGSGKSSLLQAGLAHRVRQQGLAGRTGWRIVSLRPGQQPASKLMASLLLGAEVTAGDSPAPDEWVPVLHSLLESACGPEQPLLVLFDQFEEMFTLCAEEAQRRAVAKALAEVAELCRDHFRLVLGMRSDYLGSAISLPDLMKMVKRPWVLRPPGPNNIRDIVAKPAEVSGYQFQGALSDGDTRHSQSLRERIWADPLLSTSASATDGTTPASPKAAAPLPLLEFALERLWLMAVRRGSREFTHADYDQVGGLGGAIAQYADEVYNSLPANPAYGAESQAVAERIFTGLISSEGTRRPRPRGDLETESGNPAQARRLIEHLVGERLLTIRSEPDNLALAHVDIAHEVLINRWDRLKAWLAQDPEGRALKEEFQKDAETWDRGVAGTPPRSRKHLPSPDLASGYLAWIQKSKPSLTDAQNAFAEALRFFLRRRKQLLMSGVAASLLVTVVMAVLALVALCFERDANKQRKLALGRQLAAEAETMRNQQANLLQRSVLLALEARQRLGPGEVEQALRHGLSLLPRSAKCLSHLKAVTKVAFSPGGQFLATASEDNTTRVWDTTTWREACEPLQGHDRPVYALAFSPNGKYLVTISWGRLRVWNTATWQKATGDWEEDEPVYAGAFSPDGRFLATAGRGKTAAGEGKTARVWDTTTWREACEPLQGHDGLVYAVAFSPDGTYLATASEDKTARVWEWRTGKESKPMKHERIPFVITFSPPDGKYLATAESDGPAWLWEWQTEREGTALKHEGGVSSVSDIAFSPDGRYLATASSDQTAGVWETANGRRVARMRHDDNVLAVTFSPPDGKYLATASEDGTARLWDIPSEREVARMIHEKGVRGVAFSPDGHYLATASEDKTARVWEAMSTWEGKRMAHKDQIYALAFSPDGKYLATASEDKTARVWETASGREYRCLSHKDAVNHLAFSPDGQYLATACKDQTAWVWRWQTSTAENCSPLEHDAPVNAVAFSPDGHFLATASEASNSEDSAAVVWDWKGRERVKRLLHQKNPVHAVAFHPSDAQYLATAGEDTIARVWKWQTDSEEAAFRCEGHKDRVNAVAFNPDGRYLASASSDQTVRVWEWRTRTNISTLLHEAKVTNVAFSRDRDGRYLVTTSYDKTERVWEWQTHPPREIARTMYKDLVAHADFSPDGRYLGTASRDGTAHVWPWQQEDLVSEARTRLTRNLNQEEWGRYVPGEPYHNTCPDLP